MLQALLQKKTEEAPKAEVAATPESTTYATGTASPAAKKILEEKGIAAADIKGTGRDGRVTKQDAIAAVPAMGTPPVHGVRDTSTKKNVFAQKKSSRKTGKCQKRNGYVDNIQRSQYVAYFCFA